MAARRNILIYASDVAAVIGHNKWKKEGLAFENIWKHHDFGTSYKKATERLSHHVDSHTGVIYLPPPTIDISSMVDKAISGIIPPVQQPVPMDTTEAVYIPPVPVEPISAAEHATMLVEKKEEIVRSVVETMKASMPPSSISTLDVTSIEEKTRDAVKRKVGATYESHVVSDIGLKESNTKFYKRYFEPTMCPYILGIGGKIDGIDIDGNPVEIKTRTDRIPYYPPEQDVIQLLSYIWITDTKLGTLVERVPKTGEARSTVIKPSEEPYKGLWDTVVNNLSLVGDMFSWFLSTETVQDDFMQYSIMEKYEEGWEEVVSAYQRYLIG